MENILFTEDLPIEEVSGLTPKAWICVGSGYSREEVKGLLLASGRGFVADAITTVAELCSRVLGAEPDRILGTSSAAALSRQEILRFLLSQRAIASYFPELKRLRRQRSFFGNLDRTLQEARLSFSHADESRVFSEYLESKIGKSPLREELQAFGAAYENWMEAQGLWDLPLLLRKATERLENGEYEDTNPATFPEKIFHLSGGEQESRERQFWEALGRRVEVLRNPGRIANDDPGWTWQRWHTCDDAADGLGEELAQMPSDDLERVAVVFPDQPDIRRSLLRAFENWGVPLADPRDPARLRKEEVVKWALLPLRVVGRGFRASDVQALFPGFQAEMAEKGIRKGLYSYVGEKLAPLRSDLEKLEECFGQRLTCEELGRRHLTWLSDNLAENPGSQEDLWILSFFESEWNSLSEDLKRVGFERHAPLAFWNERISSRVFEATPPVEKLRPRQGVRLFRLQQFPLESVGRALDLRLFGLPPQWLTETKEGDYWFSARERELLASEFSVRSASEIRKERARALRSWMGCAAKIELCDFTYSYDGRERESLSALLTEIGAPLESLKRPIERGAHSRWLPSHGVNRPEQPREVRLSPSASGSSGVPEISATTLDRMSRCGFQALALQRWKLWDAKEPDSELWPEVKGNILHHAVKLLLRSRDEEGRFMLGCHEALERAWNEKSPRGLLMSPRVVNYVRSRLLSVLERFCEQEKEFFLRARTKTLSLEDQKLILKYPEFAIVGEPDRIEEHPDGLFVSDFKTASALPNGGQMLELGYRLQLPFYAIAAERHYGKPVIGIQFIQLTRKGGRGSGVFFSRWNGKEAGCLTQARSNSKSLFKDEPSEVWERLEEMITRHARQYVEGVFHAKPKRSEECKSCPAADLCGYRRRTRADEEGEGEVENV